MKDNNIVKFIFKYYRCGDIQRMVVIPARPQCNYITFRIHFRVFDALYTTSIYSDQRLVGDYLNINEKNTHVFSMFDTWVGR